MFFLVFYEWWKMKRDCFLFFLFFLGLLGKWLHKFFCWFFLFYSFRFYIFWISLKICKWILLQDSKVLRVLKFVWMTFMYCTLNLCHSNILYFYGKVQITQFPGFIELLLVDHKLLILLVGLASCFSGMVFSNLFT